MCGKYNVLVIGIHKVHSKQIYPTYVYLSMCIYNVLVIGTHKLHSKNIYSMYVYLSMCICMHPWVYMHVWEKSVERTYVCMHVREILTDSWHVLDPCLYIYIYVYICKHVWLHVCAHVRMHVCMYDIRRQVSCMFFYMSMHAYTYTHTLTSCLVFSCLKLSYFICMYTYIHIHTYLNQLPRFLLLETLILLHE
jgi:hypothetical protein